MTIGLLGVAALLTATGLFLGLRGVNAGPVTDSGIAECERMRDGSPKAENPLDGIKDEAEFMKAFDKQNREIHDQFANSRYSDLRDAGTQAYDYLREDGRADKGKRAAMTREELSRDAQIALGVIRQQYETLSEACAAHGVSIPPLPPP